METLYGEKTQNRILRRLFRRGEISYALSDLSKAIGPIIDLAFISQYIGADGVTAVSYTENDDKTDQRLFVSGVNSMICAIASPWSPWKAATTSKPYRPIWATPPQALPLTFTVMCPRTCGDSRQSA